MRAHDTALPAFAPPQPEQLQKLQREHSVAILAALALFHTKQHARRVDIIDLEVGNFGHTQAYTVGNVKRGLVLDARCSFQQPGRFLHTKHTRQLAVVTGDHQCARQIPALQGHQEKKLQR